MKEMSVIHKASGTLISWTLCSMMLVGATFLFGKSPSERVRPKDGPLSDREISLINGGDSVMWVYQVTDVREESVLRTPAVEFTMEDLSSDGVRLLSRKMLSTVQASQYSGVGLAGPQVGLSRRIIVVCRLDKAGEPYEVYPNVKIDALWGDIVKGSEGCLSIPPYGGEVPRFSYAAISYVDPESLAVRKDTVSGYVARIFQHECDHLEGILFTDRVDSLSIDKKWEKEWNEFLSSRESR